MDKYMVEAMAEARELEEEEEGKVAVDGDSNA